MTTVMPHGEKVRRAVKWISEYLKEDPERPLQKLINEAILQFDLSPGEAEGLVNFYKKDKE